MNIYHLESATHTSNTLYLIYINENIFTFRLRKNLLQSDVGCRFEICSRQDSEDTLPSLFPIR